MNDTPPNPAFPNDRSDPGATPRPQLEAALEARLQAYLDGALSDADRSALEHEARTNPALRKAIERSLAIEAALRRGFAPPQVTIPAQVTSPPQAAAQVHPALDAASRGAALAMRRVARDSALASSPGARTRFRKAWLPLAAAVLFAVAAAVYFLSTSTFSPGPTLRTPAQGYARIVDAGFIPTVVCENDEQVIAFTRQYLGNPLRVDVARAAASSPPVALTLVGWGYQENVVSPRTVSLLVTADEDQIVVFADQAHLDSLDAGAMKGKCKSTGRPLRVFRATVGTTVLYEVSPRDGAVVLPLITRAE